MKKTLFKSLLLLLLLCSFAFPAFAAMSAEAEIGVEIKGGGTACITPQVNCPIPESTKVTVKDGETGHFNIEFTEPGNYSYIIKTQEEGYSPEYYTATVSVNVKEDGKLYTVTVLKKASSDTKCDIAAFTQKSDETTTTEQTTKPPVQVEDKSRPITGDDSQLEMYLLLAIAASAGLFGLSLLYANSTKKQLHND